MKSFIPLLCFVVVAAISAGVLRERWASLALTPAFRAPMLSLQVGELLAKAPDRTIAMPLTHVRRRQIAETWHARRGNRRLHEGEDIFASSGTPVYSATDGIVIRVGNGGLGGNAVSVLGAGGRVYYYAHLLRFAEDLAIGQQVTPYSLLGYVGNTGNARNTPSHLHFGVYGRTGAIDPLPLLVDRKPNRAEPHRVSG